MSEERIEELERYVQGLKEEVEDLTERANHLHDDRMWAIKELKVAQDRIRELKRMNELLQWKLQRTSVNPK